MNLQYKPDWEKTRERMSAWWAHEDFGRCAIAITAEKSGMKHEEPPSLPGRKEDWWFDFDYLHALHEYQMKHTYYGGEAIPIWNTGDRWMQIAGFIGCQIRLNEETGWADPFIGDGELAEHDYHKIVVDTSNRWWAYSDRIHRFAAQEALGKSIPAIQALGGCADTLAAIRGTQKLVLDVIDNPEYVREFDLYLMKQWIDVYEKFYDITKDAAQGSTTWSGNHLWAPGRFYFMMCDFSYMISTKMFINLFMPSLEMQCNFLDYPFYHLDGVRAFAHVDAIISELPKLKGFQIVPGDGKPNALHYMDMLKKIQRAGKNLLIFVPPEEVEIALENLSSKGLLIVTRCKTEEEALNLLNKAERLSRP